MLAWITDTRADFGLTVERLVLGSVFLAHGAQKVLGLFGGSGLTRTVTSLQQMGLPEFIAWLVPLVEFLGGIGLILGLYTRIWAVGIGVIMMGAIQIAHLQHGFFMNWFGKQAGEGFEYHLLALALTFSLVLHGGGSFSIDHSRSMKK